MRITAPISRVAEIPLLAQAGADELYCGMVPPDWVARFGSGATNRRVFGNLKDYGELAEAIAEARRAGVRLALVMNAQHYAADRVPALIELASRYAEMGGHTLIVGELGLLALLHDAVPRLALHLSSVASCRNAEAARLAHELGARRVILPRDVTLSEVGRLARGLPLEVEAFVLNDGCAFEEGTCQTIHLPSQLGGPICLDRYDSRYVRHDGEPLSEAEQAQLADNDEAYRQWLWYRMGCGFTTAKNGLPYGPCGLCALPAMAEAGVAAIKIAGREAPAERKLASVKLVSEARARVRAGASAAQLLGWASEVRGEPQHCRSGAMCYYPQVLRGVRESEA